MSANHSMSSHEDVISKLGFLRRELCALEAEQDFQDVYFDLPDPVRGGRAFSEIVYEDLFHAYYYACRGSRVAHIDAEICQMLLTEKTDIPATLAEARQHIKHEFYRYEEHEPFDHTPEFLSIFTNDETDLAFIASALIEVKKRWDALAYAIAEAAPTAAIKTRMGQYITHTTLALRRFEDLSALLAEPTPEEDDNKKPSSVSTSVAVIATEEKAEKFKDATLNNLHKKAVSAGMPDEVIKILEGELATLDSIPSTSQDYSSRMNPVIMLVNLPWNKRAAGPDSINETYARMHEKHAGLDKVKKIIVEHMAVQMRTGKPNGTILCFDGMPGVGKTSMARTIAYAMGRPLVRITLGGMYDTAQMVGHISTYSGAKAGRIISGILQAGVKNPVILLDEIDKIDHERGNLEGTLLAILDPEQNMHFKDMFINAPFDLSEIIFIATSNDKSRILPALRNRMEIINLPAYTAKQKYEIAQKHLLPDNMKVHGLNGTDLEIAPAALKRIIADYVNEPGVRDLERQLKSIMRNAAYKLQAGAATRIQVQEADLPTLLEKPKTYRSTLTQEPAVGVANGLYVAGASGGLMAFEVIKIPSMRRTLTVTGTGLMKDAMRESLSVVCSWLRAQVDTDLLRDIKIDDFELHIDAVMDGAKDGPSAGIAIASACISTLTNKPLRPDIAMTGKMTLGGRVRAVGGILQKLEGAMRNGMKTVLIPQDNAHDLHEVSAEIKSKLTIIPVAHIDDVLAHVFMQKARKSLTWDIEEAQPLLSVRPVPLLPPPPAMS